MSTKYKLLSDCSFDSFAGKTLILRVDFNVPVENRLVTDDTKILSSLPTIKKLSQNGAKVVLISHFGRPKGFDVENSLQPVSARLSQLLDCNVIFHSDCTNAQQVVKNLQNGQILLLENLRFYKEEEKNDTQFAQVLASYADYYVNEAFSCSHRAHASISKITEFLPSFMGLSLEKEVFNIEKIIHSDSKSEILCIIGGSKVSTKLNLLKNLVKKMRWIAIGGGMANTFLYANGYDIGRSICENELKDECLYIQKIAKENNCTLILPTDVVVAKKLEPNAKCRVVNLEKQSLSPDEIILDVGPESVNQIGLTAFRSQIVVWNGPLGVFEVPPFNVGTDTLARYIASATVNNGVESIIGGGDTAAAINKSSVQESISYISTGGGAFLEWLEGLELPGIKLLHK